MAPPIVVLIAVAGKNTLLDKTLASLAKCRKPTTFQETIVVENGTKYNAEAIVNAYQKELKTQYLYFERGNKSAALNYALGQIPDNTLIFFTDDDMHIDDNVLCKYAEASERKSSGFFYGGPMFAAYEKVPQPWLVDLLPASAKGWQPDGNTDYTSTARFMGCNWAAYASDLKKAGGFNEKLGPGTKPKRTGQERDMQQRLLKMGIQAIYIAEAKVWHYVPKNKSSFEWLLKRRYQDGMSAGIQFAATHGKRKLPLGFLKDFLFNILKLLTYPFYSRQKKALVLVNLYISFGRLRGIYIK